MRAIRKAVQAWLREIRVKVTSEEFDALIEALGARVMPKRITAKMLADLARRKVGCDTAGLRNYPPRCAFVTMWVPGDAYVDSYWTDVLFHYKLYGGAYAAKQAAWNFLMERPDKKGE